MYCNLIQLASSTLLEKIKVSAGQLGLGNYTFSSICGEFFSGKSSLNWVRPYLFKMLTKGEVDKMTTTKTGNEMHRLHQIKYKDFPKQDPQEDVGTDYQLLYDKIRQSFKIIDSLVNSITPIL